MGEPLFVPRAKPGSLLNGNGANNADALALYANGRDVSEQDDGCAALYSETSISQTLVLFPDSY